MSGRSLPARRNAVVLAATGLTAGALFLFPTSTNRGTHAAGRHALAPVGVVGGVPSSAAPLTAAALPVVVTINGASVDTQYGPVQVQITVRGKRVLSATAIDYPQANGRDREINSYAIPVLQRETLTAQSARIDTVSGATYTSDGYVSSLQSALDAAHL